MSRLRRIDLLSVAAVLASVALVALAAHRSIGLAVLLTAGLGVLIVVWLAAVSRKGMLALMTALMLVVLTVPDNYTLSYRIPIGGGGIFVSDMLVALLAAGVVLTLLTERRFTFPRSPVTLPLLLFLCWVAITAGLGHVRGNELKYILADVRTLGYYVLFFWVIVYARDRRTVMVLLKVLAVCLVLDIAVGAVSYLSGQGGAVGFVETGVSRFPAPHDIFLGASVLLAAWIVVWPSGQRRPRVLWPLLGLALAALAMSLVRGYYVAFAAGLAYLLLIVRTRERARLLVGIVVVAALFGAGVAVVRPALLESVIKRATAVTALNDPNIQFRLIENHDVWPQVVAHPIEGSGLGTGYVFDFSRYGVAPYVKYYIHNNYLWFWQRMGLVGLGLFAWFISAFLFGRHRLSPAARNGDPWLAGLVIGSRPMIVALLVASITSPLFNTKENVAAIATVMGLVVVAQPLLAKAWPDAKVGDEQSEGVAAVVAGEPAAPPGGTSVVSR
jgi:O-antigen ligase